MKFISFAVLLFLTLTPRAVAQPERDNSSSPPPAVIRTIVLVPDDSGAALAPAETTSGIDASRLPGFPQGAATKDIAAFLGRPITPDVVNGLAAAVRAALQADGRLFWIAHVPPQDVSAGVIRVVASPAKLDGEMAVEGARYYPEALYRDAVPLAAGGEIDAVAIQIGRAHV